MPSVPCECEHCGHKFTAHITGGHLLLCGDATDKATVELVLDGQRPHLMVTDPPYGVSYDASWRDGTVDESTGVRRGRVGNGPLAGRAKGKVLNDDRADWREAWALFPGAVAYIWHAGIKADVVAASLAAADFELRSQIIWKKNHIAIGRSHYHWMHEPCWYAVRTGSNGHWSGDRKQSTIWEIDKPKKSETGHSTQKPVECMARPMRNNSQPGDRVYEPFSGSGTTIIAGQMNKRVVHACELNPAYVDVAVRRWEEFTGQKAVLADTGESFEAVKLRRVEVV